MSYYKPYGSGTPGHYINRTPQSPARPRSGTVSSVGEASIDEGLGRLVSTISLPQESSSSIVRVEDVEPVASYSWVPSSKKPTIYVPGAPRIWANIDPRRVPQDAGLIFIDQNSYRMGTKSPLIPLFAAVDMFTDNSFDYTSVDVVSDRNGLRKLLRWATSSAELEDFRIDIDKAGASCIFTRVEKMDSEIVTEFRGFGFEYAKAATKPAKGLEAATGYHRIISMDFGGINILLRFEVDACAELEDQSQDGDDEDDLVSAMKSLGIRRAAPAPDTTGPTTELDDIVIRRSKIQTLVPQSSLIELSTRAARLCYLARHTRGVFGSVEKTKLADMTQQAALAQRGMARLKATLVKILVAVRAADRSQFSLVCKDQQLRLYERSEGAGKPIPADILHKFVSPN